MANMPVLSVLPLLFIAFGIFIIGYVFFKLRAEKTAGTVADYETRLLPAEILAARIASLSLVVAPFSLLIGSDNFLLVIGYPLSLVICLIISAKYATRKNAASTRIKIALTLSTVLTIVLVIFLLLFDYFEGPAGLLPSIILITVLPCIFSVPIIGLFMAFYPFPMPQSDPNIPKT